MSYRYDEVFQRNIGVFSKEEQQKIRESTVFIAGTGGVGSPTAIALTRLGVGKLIISDLDTYEASNLNRQLPSTIKTIGQSKVKVVAEHLKEIHPFTEVVAIEGGINKSNVDELVSQSDLVVSSIDGCMTMVLQRSCKKHEKLCLTAALLKEKVMSTTFPPDGISICDFYPYEVDESDMDGSEKKYKLFLNAMFKKGDLFEKGYAPTTSSGIFIAGGILSYQAAFYLARKQMTIPAFPAHIIFDPNDMTCKAKLKILDCIRKSSLFGGLFKLTVKIMAKVRLSGLPKE